MAATRFKGSAVRLAGKEVGVGDPAPEVVVVDKGLADRKVGGAQGKVQVLASVPSLDTPVCATETRKFNQQAASIPGAEVTVISMDLPFAMGRFCSTEGIDKVSAASDFRKKEFSSGYGVLVDEGPLTGLACRAVFVVGKDGKVVHKEIVEDIAKEPDYQAALDAAKKAA